MNKVTDATEMTLSRGLCASDFTRIAVNGFGDAQNSYVYSMAHFGNHVYAGTLRNALPLLKLYPPRDAPSMDPWPVRTVDRVEDLDLQAQIWRWSLEDGRWEKAFASPMITGRNRKKAPRDLGYRGMVVFQGRSDSGPVLYISTVSTVLRGTAARILRSEDGLDFTPVSEPGLGDSNVSTFRSLVAFDDHLFAAPAGEGTSWNTCRNPVILRSADPVAGCWETICPPGFGDPTNTGVFELAVFNDHLYAGTFNYYEGFQIWKTPATGRARCRWTKVIQHGAYRGNHNETTMGMCAFDGALYVGSGIQNGGYDRTNMVGPAAGEMIRIYPDDSWDLVVGTPRQTPDGTKYPLSGMGPGFDNMFAGYIWRMAVHEEWLYVTTFDWSMFLAYAQRPGVSVKRIMRRFGVDQMIRLGSGFQLWRSRDGSNWIPVTSGGMGNPYNHGGRALLSTPHGLFLGTANPFGPDVAAKLSTGWIYVPNPDGGAEVWLGRPRFSFDTGELRGNKDSINLRDGRANRDASNGEDASFGKPLNERFASRSTPTMAKAKPARVLITGVPGLVGSPLLTRLLEQEDRIRVYALPETVNNIPHRDRVAVVTGDLRTGLNLKEALCGVEIVYHLAALLPGSPYDSLMRLNVHGTEHLLRACAEASRVRRFIFASSVAVYGVASSPDEWPFTEASPLRPRGSKRLRLYGLSKVSAEALVQKYAREHEFEYVIVRPSTVYGPGNKRMTNLIGHVLAQRFMGDGQGGALAMQPIHVVDLVAMLMRAGQHPDAANDIFNMAGLEVLTFRNLAMMIRRLGGISHPATLAPDPSGVWRRYAVHYDITKAQQALGFKPAIPLAEGIAEMVTDWEAEGFQAEPYDFTHEG